MKSHVDKKILGFDMDGVIVDNSALKLKVAKSMGIHLSPLQTPAEIIKKYIDADVLRKLQLAIYHNPLISLDTKLMPGIKDLLDKVKEKKIPYFLVSRRLEPQITIDMLSKKGIWKKYFDKSNAFFVVTPEDKNTKAKALGITHYVDDETKILSALSDVPNRFLFDHLNVFPDSDKYTRVSSHEALSKYFL